tara:strand:- start:5457 stop:6563 length:1107 start_codon:yes stop_codon:yes gene_type:complete
VKYYIIAGEASGDLHGSNLIKEIKKLDRNYEFRCWGGDLIKEQCGDLVKHYKDYSYMGFFEVFKNIIKIVNNISLCKNDILSYKPDAIIYVDFPGFNLRIAKWAKSKNFTNHFYISPQIWAWKESRIKIIRKVIDQMFVILPFEKKYYNNLNFEVNYVGHPLLDELKNKGKLNEKREKIIALLPGSRDQEISKILPLMLSITQEFKDYKFVICGAPSKTKLFYEEYIKKIDSDNIEIVQNQTYKVLKKSCAALVTSGTATLEAALFKTPQVVCYKSSWISFQIGKILLKDLKFISLVNLILNKTVVKELIQGELNKKNIIKELKYIISEDGKKGVLNFYDELEKLLSKDGASKETASKIVKYHLDPNS